jgi:hypothetical protein
VLSLLPNDDKATGIIVVLTIGTRLGNFVAVVGRNKAAREEENENSSIVW